MLDRDGLFGLLLTLRAGHNAFRLAGDLRHDSFLLIFRQVLDQNVIRTFQIRVLVDLFEDTFPDALLAVQFAHFVQNDGPFETVARHALNVGPILGVVVDVGVNFPIHFRVVPKRGSVSGGGIAAGAWWR